MSIQLEKFEINVKGFLASFNIRCLIFSTINLSYLLVHKMVYIETVNIGNQRYFILGFFSLSYDLLGFFADNLTEL